MKSVLIWASELFGALLHFALGSALVSAPEAESLQEGLGCVATSSDFTLWSVERPLKGLEQINDVTQTPSGDYWSGSLMENEEKRAERQDRSGNLLIL